MARKPKKPKPKPKPRRTGRPPLFSQKLAERVCERIAQGDSLVKVCRQAWAPSYSTVMKWLRDSAEFSQMYARAREDQADWHADEIVAIADEATADDVQVAKLRVDARKWTASKLKPRKYGDRLSQEISGPDGGPIRANFNLRSEYDDLSDEELEDLYRKKLRQRGVEP